jgi:ATP-dependent Lhr-like helicase
VLSRILTESLPPVAALYVCPIRALLNNQEPRIQQYARMVGLEAFKWHGDVAATAKARFIREPKHLLMITPESLEVMLISQKADARALFAGLSAVIIDEIHAFAADDRGAHLVSILERLSRFCGRDIQRIGLSATVGNPDEIGRWLHGSSKRAYRRIDPPRPPSTRDIRVDFVDGVVGVASEAARLGQGKKSLVFVESRGQAEKVAAAMAGRGVEVFVHHSAVSRADRQEAEEKFANGQNTAIVCTSTMELGIDVGDLDLVVQVDAPATVASFQQRIGRTGRRAGTRSNATFLCQTPETLLQAAALVRLSERGWVEDVRPARAAAHILAHQILALTLQEGGISRHEVLPWIASASPFVDLGPAQLTELVDHMIAQEILYEADGLLSLGTKGEKLYGAKHFFELYAVFSSPPVLRVLHGATEVGTIQALFLTARKDGQPLCFRLGGRAWLVTDIDWGRGTCRVAPAEHGRTPAWLGRPFGLSYQLCQEMKATLHDGAPLPWLTPAAMEEMKSLVTGYEGLVEPGVAALEAAEGAVEWHTFAGAAINRLLAVALSRAGAGRWAAGNLSLRSKDCPGVASASAAVSAIANEDWLALANAEAEGADFEDLSKFQVCLPPMMERELVRRRMFDVEETGEFVRTCRLRTSA